MGRRPTGTLASEPGRPRIEDADGVLAAVGREDAIPALRDERPGDACQALDRVDVARLVEIDDIEGVVRGVGDVHPPESAMDRGVIEAALPAMLRKLEVALKSKRHPRSAGADLVLCPGVERVVHGQLELELALVVDAE